MLKQMKPSRICQEMLQYTKNEKVYRGSYCYSEGSGKPASCRNISFTSNDSIIYNQSYNLKITLYGNESLNLSNKIIARLRTEKIRNSIYDEGIYLEKIENPKSLNEFINDVLWLRTDFNILLSCEFLYSQVEQDNNMENTSSIKLIDV